MKKQLLIAAVAATMTSAAMADISITGDAKFEYQNKDYSNTATPGSNTTNTEVNLSVKGKTGDTSVVADIEINTHGKTTTANTLDVENLYMATKIGDISIKAGNYSSGTSGILGEIDNGNRATNKVHLSTSMGGVSVYAGDSGAASGVGATQVKGNMYYGASTTVGGFKVEAKHNSPTQDSFAISGDVAGFGVRLEQMNNDGANKDATFGNITKEMNGINFGYAWIDGDESTTAITEEDSAIFAVEVGELQSGVATQKTGVKGVSQFSASTAVAGNTVTVKAGSLDGKATYRDSDFMQIDVKRALTSGATLALTYTDADIVALSSATQHDVATFEVDLSVKF